MFTRFPWWPSEQSCDRLPSDVYRHLAEFQRREAANRLLYLRMGPGALEPCCHEAQRTDGKLFDDNVGSARVPAAAEPVVPTPTLLLALLHRPLSVLKSRQF
jgi:hypothetical protein